MKGINLLGLKVQDRVTGFEGIVTSLSYDLYGCVQAVLNPKVKDKVKIDSVWYDIKRLKILDKKPVMEVPNFDNEVGSEIKPLK